MKKSILLFCFFAFLFVYSQEKDTIQFIAIYTFKYQLDSTNSKKKMSENALLFLGKEQSKFMTKNKYMIDSLLATKNPSFDMKSYPKTNFNFQIYKHQNNIVYSDLIYTQEYFYNETVNFNWKLTQDTLTINNYKCKKALCSYGGRQWVAWFAEEIPIFEGPYKFSGLPGLIIQINDIKNQYSFVLNSFYKIKNKKSLNTNFSLESNEVSKKYFFNAMKKFKENPLISIENDSNMTLVLNEEIKNRIKNRYKSENNPIELTED